MSAVKLNAFTCGKHALELGSRTYIMGILNITPDSFSDGGSFIDAASAFARATVIRDEGGDIIDIGGESTRPGYAPVDEREQLRRVLPVVEAAVALGLPVSIDTTLPGVAARCIDAGACIINDVSGVCEPYALAALAARNGTGLVITHNRPVMGDVADEMARFFERAFAAALREGVRESAICLDPGIGFNKSAAQSVAAIRALRCIKAMGFPVLLGASRKSFIGELLGAQVGDRLEGSLAALVTGIAFGADIARVHDVAQSARAAKVADVILRRRKSDV